MYLTDELLDKLQQLKEQTGYSNDEIGRRAGLSTATARRYITGEVKDAPMETVKKIIAALGGDPEEIISGKDDIYMEAAMLRSMLQEAHTNHKDELARMSAAHKEVVFDKNKWLNRLFWVCLVLGALLLVLLIWALKLDSMIADFGLIQY